jgi:hypothetical protein
MAISEGQLEIWSRRGSVVQSSTTYATIKNALESTQSPYAARDYSVFLQGSYGNDTNIYAESDVDVVIVLNETYYSDLSDLSDEDKVKCNQARTDASYGYTKFKRDVNAWLKQRFGSGVNVGNKAIFIPGNGSRRDADVVVAAAFHRYDRFETFSNSSYAKGICFWTSDNVQIVNFPKQHADNCIRKHDGTNRYYKPFVRVIKNLRNKMVEEG